MKTVNIKWNLIAWSVKIIQKTDLRVLSTSNGKAMISKRAASGSKKSRFIKNKEAKRLWSSLGL